MKHIWRICGITETVSHSVTNLSVPESVCALYALHGFSGDFLPYFVLRRSPPIHQWPYFVLRRSPPIHQWPFVDLSQCTILIEDLSSNEFFVLHVTSFQSSEPTWLSFRSLARTRCSISVPHVPKKSSKKKKIFLSLECLQWDPVFYHMHHLLLSAHAVQLICCLCPFTVYSLLGPQFAHAIVWSNILQYLSVRVGTISQIHNVLSRMFHKRWETSFLSYTGFFNLAAMYGG